MKNNQPLNGTKMLLHVCCAPCSGGIIETLIDEGADLTVFFYNPNVHPLDEYERRKASVTGFVQRKNIPFVDADYDPERWLERIQGLENEPERGQRCQTCFDMRLEKAALYAHEHGFPVMATTNGISRWKDKAQVCRAGINAVSRYDGLSFLDRDWRKQGGVERSTQVVKRENFYRQVYCGCKFSMKDKSPCKT